MPTQAERRIIIICVAIVFVLPLSLVKNMAKLAKSSALSITAVCWIVLIVIVRSFTGVSDDVPVPATEDEKAIKVINDHVAPGIGVIAFAFVCHHSCFIVFNSLKVGAWRDASSAGLAALMLPCHRTTLNGGGGRPAPSPFHWPRRCAACFASQAT